MKRNSPTLKKLRDEVHALKLERNDLLKDNKELRETLSKARATNYTLEKHVEMFEKSSMYGTHKRMRYQSFKNAMRDIALDLHITSSRAISDCESIINATANPEDHQALCLSASGYAYRRAYYKIKEQLQKLDNEMDELKKNYKQTEIAEQKAEAFSDINIHRGSQAGAED